MELDNVEATTEVADELTAETIIKIHKSKREVIFNNGQISKNFNESSFNIFNFSIKNKKSQNYHESITNL